MSDPYDLEEIRELIHRHLEQSLTEEERSRLESLLSEHEAVRRELILAAALHQELFTLHEAPPLEAAKDPSPLDLLPPAPSAKRLTTARSTRRASREVQAFSWVPAAAAAAVLVGLALLVLSLEGGESRTSKPRHDSARLRDDAPATQTEPVGDSAGDAEAERTLEEKIRADAGRRLADLEQRRLELVRAAPPEAPNSLAPETPTKKDLGTLDAEKRQIEEELKEAIARAKSNRDRASAPPAERVETAPAEPPAAPLTGSIAQVERVEGLAFLVRADGKLPLREGLEIVSGDGLEGLGEASRIQIRFPDKTRLDLKGEALLSEIAEGERGSAAASGPGKRMVLARGLLSADVAKQAAGRPLVIKSAHAEAQVLGTVLRLRVDPGEKGATRLEVLEGRVHFTRTSDKKALEISTGHMAVAAASIPFVGRPIPPVRTGTPEKPVLVSVTLVNADTGRTILQHDPLEDGMVLTLADLPTRNLNIQAFTSPATVGCVVLSWDGVIRIEGRAPYLLGGNTPAGKPLAWTPDPGDHTLVVTPYSGPAAANRREGTGTAGAALTLRLRVR